MLSQFTIRPISAITKGEIKRLRKAGFIPVSIQHAGMSTQHFQQEAVPLDEYIRRYGDGVMLDLLLTPGTEPQRAMVQNVQRDGVTGRLLHVTFQQVRKNELLKTHVALIFTGEPLAARHGEALVQHRVDRLNIECAQKDLPDHITVHIGDLALGDVIHVSDLPIDVRYRILTPPKTVLASLTMTRAALGKDTPVAA